MDTKNKPSDSEEPSAVNEGAFWHTNMDLYYGFSSGELVEVEHEPDKYWLASIEYCYKQLVLLKWIGNYGDEFWVDTSNQNSSLSSTTSCSGAPSGPYGNPKRIYSLGHHQLPSLRSQFTLEKPRKILEKPSLYNPAKDPYANVRTIDDLLKHEFEETNNDDTFAGKSASDTASLALAKCKSKINYGQEDEDELEAALQALTGLDQRNESPQLESNIQEPVVSSTSSYTSNQPLFNKQTSTTTDDLLISIMTPKTSDHPQQQRQVYWEDDKVSQIKYLDSDSSEEAVQYRKDRFLNLISRQSQWLEIMKNLGRHFDALSQNKIASKMFKLTDFMINAEHSIKIFANDPNQHGNNRLVNQDESQQDSEERDASSLKLCKDILDLAQQGTKYYGVDSSGLKHNDISHPLRPKILYDLGGANHERLLARGTLLTVSHTVHGAFGQLDQYNWFAIVVKNVGGRLTLRWFLCDEPKFKQGRLEMKSCASKWVAEEPEPSQLATSNNGGDNKADCSISDTNNGTNSLPDLSDLRSPPRSSGNLISSRALTFSMHFCNPRISSIPEYLGSYRFPNEISSHLKRFEGFEYMQDQECFQKRQVSDTRRRNLDRDRPLIDELIKAVRSSTPSYLKLNFGHRDLEGRREVLMSCPKMPKLIRATIQQEIEPGVFEVHSDPLNDTDEVIKFVYPRDSSYTILPLEWSNSNSDCLSVHPSRNPSPTPAPLEEKVASNDHEQTNLPTETPTIQPKGRELTGAEPDPDEFLCQLDYKHKTFVEERFKVMDQLEMFHPTSDHIICSGRIRKVVFPLLWIQLSSDCYTLVPFNHTDIYPAGWCKSHGLKLVSLLPPRRPIEIDGKGSRQRDTKRSRKKVKISHKSKRGSSELPKDEATDSENFDLVNLDDRQAGIDYILKERSAYIKIYFNHKCFTGPSLSKSKICTLPQYVGPGPMRLVIEEVVTKLISVGYVPPRVLNDLSSDSFKALLIERNLTKTTPMEFKAKYQKRVHREKVPVCVNQEEVKLYCECICEHIKCCYNLFGLNLYDGEFCPSNCRSLTKSNKFMKRATYYRDKARQGESPNITSTTNNGGDNNRSSDSNKTNNNNGKRKAASLLADDPDSLELDTAITGATINNATNNLVTPSLMETPTPEMDNDATRVRYNGRGSSDSTSSSNVSRSDEEMDNETMHKVQEWTIDDVARYLEQRKLGIFKTYMQSEGIDGQALMLLSRPAIEEHFQVETQADITQEDVNKLCDTVDLFKTFSKIY